MFTVSNNQHSLPTLYKKDSKSKLRRWDVKIIDHQDQCEIVVSHGADGGAIQDKSTFIKCGKNLGKSNETTILEQAKSEAQSKFNKQLDKGYSLYEDLDKKPFRPMLAKKYQEHSHKVKFPCYAQAKLDGLRCFIQWCSKDNKPRAYSRNGKQFTTLDHILKECYSFLKSNQSLILDGEVFSDKISFQQIISAIKRDERVQNTDLIHFWCYDVFDTSNPKLKYSERYSLIPVLKYFVTCPTYTANNEQEIFNHHHIIKQKFEGTIIRNALGIYKVDGRSHDLLKLKDFQDREYLIVDKRLDKNEETVFVCLDEEINETFECKPKGSHEERVALYYEDNLGKMLTVEFFEFTDKGIPRFPIGRAIRDYE